MKPFKLGIVIGRFQVLHKGHEYIINKGIELCDKFIVYIGSSQESGTEKNPYSYEFRKKVLELIYGDKIEIKPIPDIGIGNNESWGKYVLNTVYKDFGVYPDLIVSGNEARRDSWFNSVDAPMVSELILNKLNIMVSSTDMKEYMFNNKYELWCNFTNPKIYKLYDEMRDKYIAVRQNTETRSI